MLTFGIFLYKIHLYLGLYNIKILLIYTKLFILLSIK